jgi:hypothetical protein
MEEEQVQVLIDGIDEADTLGEQMKSPDAAVGQSSCAVGDLVVDVGGREGGPAGVAEAFVVESSLDSALAVGELLVYLGVHSKSLFVGVDDGVATSSDVAESQRISSFFQFLSVSKHGDFA